MQQASVPIHRAELSGETAFQGAREIDRDHAQAASIPIGTGLDTPADGRTFDDSHSGEEPISFEGLSLPEQLRALAQQAAELAGGQELAAQLAELSGRLSCRASHRRVLRAQSLGQMLASQSSMMMERLKRGEVILIAHEGELRGTMTPLGMAAGSNLEGPVKEERISCKKLDWLARIKEAKITEERTIVMDGNHLMGAMIGPKALELLRAVDEAIGPIRSHKAKAEKMTGRKAQSSRKHA